MQFTLSHSGQTGVQTTTVYPNQVTITDEISLQTVVQFDHVAGLFLNNTRSNANFILSDVLVMDIDNDHSENPDEWITLERLKEIFADYNFALVTSRSHMQAKAGKAPRPKYHIYFQINEVTDKDVYVAMKEELCNQYKFFDDNAKDAARFFFGNPNAQVICHDSWLTIDEDLFQAVSIDDEEDFDADFYTPLSGSIQQGSRNSTMSVFAAKILKRLGVTQEARDGFDEQAEKCEPPLDKAELDTIWGSAVRFYNKTIKSSEGYVSPEQFNRETLRPDDYSDVGEAGVLAREYCDKLAYTNATDYLYYDGTHWRENKQLALGPSFGNDCTRPTHFNLTKGLRTMREKYVEQALVKSVKARGGICPKWVSPSFSGVPDRLVFLPNGKFGLVEVKAPGGKPRLLQVTRHRLFERLGFKVYVLDSVEKIGEVLDEIETT